MIHDSPGGVAPNAKPESQSLTAVATGDSANLDFIRAVAVLCVAFHHLMRLSGYGTDFTWAIGHMGVLIFFVHTSLVLMLSLERSATRLPGRALVLDFYLRRWFRIYPLSIVFVTVAFLQIVPSRPEPWAWSTYLSNLALTTNLTYSTDMWSVLWTLPLEVQMYGVLPVIFLLGRRRGVGWAAGLWLVAVGAALAQPLISGRLTVLAYAPCFVGGVVAWRLLQTAVPRWQGGWWPIAFVASWGIWLAAPRTDPALYRWAFCLALGVLIPWFREIKWRPLVATVRPLARYSYGIYLSHLPIMMYTVPLSGVTRWLLMAALLIVVPVILFHGIEQPLINAGRRLAGRATSGLLGMRTRDRVAGAVVPAS
jgi:peptidoglycan/LPS O-acetylase OafA/YrhL